MGKIKVPSKEERRADMDKWEKKQDAIEDAKDQIVF